MVPKSYKCKVTEPYYKRLIAANGSNIKTYGQSRVGLVIDGRHVQHKVVVADVLQPIMGRDFLRTCGCLIDPVKNKLIFKEAIHVDHIEAEEGYEQGEKAAKELLRSYPRLLKVSLGAVEPSLTPLMIDTGNASPVFSNARPLYGDKRKQIEAEIKKWESEGIITRVKDPVEWASPIHSVKKSNGTWRVCGDFRRLNAVTVKDNYPLPTLASFNAKMADCTVFSKIDLRRAYHQIGVQEQDKKKTVINTTLGLFRFERMPFGLKNAGSQFQRNIHLILHDFQFMFVYMDDLIIYSRTFKEHLNHLKLVFDRLSQHHVLVNEEKCVFVQKNLEFLGHIVSKEGISVPESRVDVIQKFPVPNTKKDLERFLGLFAFVHRFIRNASEIVQPLNKLRSLTKNQTLAKHWEVGHAEAFQKAKAAIREASLLVHPRSDARTELWTDASNLAIGAVLVQQQKTLEWRPIAYWSKSFNNAQRNYSPFDKEMLALSYSVQHFREYLEGQEVVVKTDHKPLVGAWKKSSNSFSPLQRRHFNRIAQYVDKIEHLSGDNNEVADALSRIELKDNVLSNETTDEEVTESQLFQDIATGCGVFALEESTMPTPVQFKMSQEADTSLMCWVKKHQECRESEFVPGEVPCRDVKGVMLWANCAREPPQILVPSELQRVVFSHVHNLAHPGVQATFKMVSNHYYWPRMKKDIQSWVRSCHSCQKNKVHRHIRSPLERLPQPSARFQHIHIDLVGPLNPPCEGKNTLLTVMDRWTGWPEAYPITMKGDAASASNCAKILVNQWISRFGVPGVITSDRGPQFVSKLWAEVSKLMGIRHDATTAYHPQHNGLVERMHRDLKNALRTRLDGRVKWLAELPWALLGLRLSPNLDTGKSPAVMVYGQQLDIPGLLVQPDVSVQNWSSFSEGLAQAMAAQQFRGTSWHGVDKRKTFVPKDIWKSEYVLVRNDQSQPSLRPRYSGPYQVLNRSDKHFTIQLPSARCDTVSIDRLKPFFTEDVKGKSSEPTCSG